MSAVPERFNSTTCIPSAFTVPATTSCPCCGKRLVRDGMVVYCPTVRGQQKFLIEKMVEEIERRLAALERDK